ncbi:helix-turn-helix domain-containing protein [Arabiibacter massiliensis]|uniref:helix-turn-helix domain-containing protein n=1 Tax=Arabiibacter massiliensis TaxID=1870985 RepID=UPI0009BC20A9|nr:helix-turn-helix domain-containing protein [Arabiibacter massiliensis]
MKYELTEKKAAHALGVSLSRVSQLVGDKQLDAITINGKVRISQESVTRYLEESKRPGRPPRTSYATASRHTLMNADYEVASTVYDTALDDPLSVEEVIDPSRAPLGVLTTGGRPKKRELNDWWRHRSIPGSRPGLDAKLLSLGIDSPSNLAVRSMGLSLSDCYWLRPSDSPDLAWADVNFFDNPFVESSPDGWDGWLSGVGLSSPDNTSEGELPKKWVADESGRRLLLKGCRADDQRPYNEAVATALYRRLLLPEDFVAYDVVETIDGPASRCANFLKPREEYVPAIYVKDLGGRIRAANNYDRFCRTVAALGANEAAVRSSLSKMILCDVILANSDRHWRNFGFVRDIDALELRVAPLFDSGNSLWFDKNDREINARDWAFMARPFAQDAASALACVDDLSWFNPSALDGFADEACDILSASRHAAQPGRLDFIREGLERTIAQVRDAAKVLVPRIERGR